MRDEDDRHAELGAQSLEQPHDLRLDRHVERGRRLVGDQKLGLGQERHGDHDALAHAAGELVRIVADPPLRVGDADRVQHLDGARPHLPPRQAPGCFARCTSIICVSIEKTGLSEVIGS